MSFGPDGIPSFLVRDYSTAFAKPLTDLFNLPLKCKEYVTKWRETRICSIFKSGDKFEISNYRSITLLWNFSKALESVLNRRLHPFVENFPSLYQYGFVNKISKVRNLLLIIQYISEVLENRGQVDDTDFSKGFESLDYDILRRLLNFDFTQDSAAFI